LGKRYYARHRSQEDAATKLNKPHPAKKEKKGSRAWGGKKLDRNGKKEFQGKPPNWKGMPGKREGNVTLPIPNSFRNLGGCFFEMGVKGG